MYIKRVDIQFFSFSVCAQCDFVLYVIRSQAFFARLLNSRLLFIKHSQRSAEAKIIEKIYREHLLELT
jgi:hypothetical protein